MATGFNIPSMFEARQAVDRQMETDAQTAGRLPLGGGMMYASSMVGDIRNQGLQTVAGMLGGVGNPIMDQQRAITEVMDQFPDPQSAEDYTQIAGAMNSKGLYNYAAMAMDRANEIKSQLPTTTYKTEKVGVMKDGKRYTQTWQVDNNGNMIKMLGEQLTSEPAKESTSSTFNKVTLEETTTDGLLVKNTYEVTANGERKLIATVPLYKPEEDKIETNPLKPVHEATAETIMGEQYSSLVKGTPEYDSMFDAQVKIVSDKYDAEIKRLGNAKAFDPVVLMQQTNPATLKIDPRTQEAGELYNEQYPNGRNYTNVEAQVASREYKRAGELEAYQIMENEENFKNTTALITADAEKAQTSRDELNNLNTMINLLEEGAKTGFGQNFKDAYGSFLEGIGISNPQVASQDILRTFMKRAALERLSFLKGAASDKDIDFVEAAGAQMNKSEEANLVILKTSQILHNRTLDINRHMRQWATNYESEKGMMPSPLEYGNEKDRYRNRGQSDFYPLKEGETAVQPISEAIKVTMDELLNYPTDLEFNAEYQSFAENDLLLDKLQTKYGQ
jgi:hypothetical protein